MQQPAPVTSRAPRNTVHRGPAQQGAPAFAPPGGPRLSAPQHMQQSRPPLQAQQGGPRFGAPQALFAQQSAPPAPGVAAAFTAQAQRSAAPRVVPPVTGQAAPRVDPPVTGQAAPRVDPPVTGQAAPRVVPPATGQAAPRVVPPATGQAYADPSYNSMNAISAALTQSACILNNLDMEEPAPPKEVEVITITTLSPGTRYAIANNFCLTELNHSYMSQPSVSKTVPCTTEPTISLNPPADGNCFYHALSYIITGTTRNHEKLRTLVAQELSTNYDEYVKGCFNTTGLDKYSYFRTVRPGLSGRYATETECYVTSKLLGLPLCMYMGSWQCENRYTVFNAAYCVFPCESIFMTLDAEHFYVAEL